MSMAKRRTGGCMVQVYRFRGEGRIDLSDLEGRGFPPMTQGQERAMDGAPGTLASGIRGFPPIAKDAMDGAQTMDRVIFYSWSALAAIATLCWLMRPKLTGALPVAEH